MSEISKYDVKCKLRKGDEVIVLTGNLRLDEDLEQQVTQFLLKVRDIASLDGEGDLIGLLKQCVQQGRMRLLTVPRALLTQLCDEQSEFLDSRILRSYER